MSSRTRAVLTCAVAALLLWLGFRLLTLPLGVALAIVWVPLRLLLRLALLVLGRPLAVLAIVVGVWGYRRGW